MSQFANPISQDSNTGWSPNPVTPNVRKDSAVETPFAVSDVDPVGKSFQVKLSPVAEPGSGAGTLRVQHRLNGPDTTRTLYFALRQGRKRLIVSAGGVGGGFRSRGAADFSGG
jgi:hypothetical protein